MDAAWPLVERQRHLRRIAEAVRRPRRRALVVTGAAGLGKTRLAVEALRQAERQGLPTRWAVATQAAATLPFAAVAHLLPDAQPSASPVELLAQARRFLDGEAGGRRVVLGIDDVHLLDAASAALVGHLATSGTAFLLCTLRSGESAPGAVTALVAGGEGETLTLEGLSEEAVTAVLVGVLGGQVDGAAVHRLLRLSGGNPLLLRELFDDARQRGAFCSGGGLWRLADGWSPGERLPDFVRARLEGLPPTGREAAQALALAEPLEADLLEALFAGDALAALDEAGLLEALPDERRHRLRLVHPLYGEALRATAPPLRSRVLHRRLAGALLATGARRGGDVLRLGTWLLAAGQAGDAATFLAAARRASVLFDHALAERLARAAVQAGGGLAAALALADAVRWQGRTAEADALLADWENDTGSDDGRARMALISIYGSSNAGQPGVEELLDKAEALVSDRSGRDQLAALRADLALASGRPREALDLARPLMTDPDAGPDAVVMASETAAAALTFVARGDEALTVITSALSLIHRGDLEAAGVLEAPLLAERAFAHVVAGRLESGRALAAEAYRHAVDRGVAPPRAWYGLLQGIVDLLGGALPGALLRLRESAELMRAHPSAQGRHVRVWALGLLAEAAAVHADLGTARAALAEADAVAGPALQIGSRGRGRAWVAAAAGEPVTARATVLAAADTANAAGASLDEALALHDAIRLGVSGRDLRRAADRLAPLAEDTDGALVRALAGHAAALRDRDPEALDRAAATLAELGLLPRAAEACAQAARAWGRTARGRAATTRARDLAARCDGARIPALALDDDAPSPLTPREREVATLAAGGLTSAQIAARLVVSTRTVDNHLYRIYAKLGITSRDDLPR